MDDLTIDDIPEEQAPAAAADPLFSGEKPMREALEQLRLRLLDLTNRNSQISHKHPAKSCVRMIHSDFSGVYARLYEQGEVVTIKAVPEPEDADLVRHGSRTSRPDVRQHARDVGLSTEYDLDQMESARRRPQPAEVHALYYADDLARHCQKIERETNLRLQETGANMLYLVFGFLEYFDSRDSSKALIAPLIAVPVALERNERPGATIYKLRATGEDPATNLSLAEKLKRDFTLKLPVFSPEEDRSIDGYLEQVEETISAHRTWRVRRLMTLTHLSFTNMLMVRDLEPELWPEQQSLIEHPLIQQIFKGKTETASDGVAHPIDGNPKANLPLIYDADSSQHSALIDAVDGKTMVIVGPPGTGKSQTITNLIACGIALGKRILFVAEKAAALDVVKNRLTQAGLEPFLLELHGSKVDKASVIQSLGESINPPPAPRSEIDHQTALLDARRQDLKAYADLLNSVIGNEQGLTLHQVMWRAERHRLKSGDSAAAVDDLDISDARNLTPLHLESTAETLRHLADHFRRIECFGPQHPFWGFFADSLGPEDDRVIGKILQGGLARFAQFAKATHGIAQLLEHEGVQLPKEGARELAELLSNIAPASPREVDYEALPLLFQKDDPNGEASTRILADFESRQKALRQLRARIQQTLLAHSPVPVDGIGDAQGLLGKAMEWGLGGLTQEAVGQTVQQFNRLASEVDTHLQSFSEAAQVLGFEFKASSEELDQLLLITERCAAAKPAVLNRRHPGLESLDAPRQLERLLQERDLVERQRVELEALLYLEAPPDGAALLESIQILREGQTWFRVFQSPWRRAVRFHHTLSREKRKWPAHERLSHLERLNQHQVRRRQWEEDASLRQLAGPHFQGPHTDLRELAECAVWIRGTIEAFESIGMSVELLHPIESDRKTILKLASLAPRLAADHARLRAMDQAIDQLFSGSRLSKLPIREVGFWPQRKALLLEMSAGLDRAYSFLKSHIQPQQTIETAQETLALLGDLPKLEQSVTHHAAASALLGHRFNGEHTDVETLGAALSLGKAIRQAKLPVDVERVLISDRCHERHARLSSFAEQIQEGWDHVEAFGREMSAHGRFDSKAWANPLGGSLKEYSDALIERTTTALDNLLQLLPWTQYILQRSVLIEGGLERFVLGLEAGAIEPDRLESVYRHRVFASIVKGVSQSIPVLRNFSGEKHSAIRKEFASLDVQTIKSRGAHIRRVRRGTAATVPGNNGTRVGDKTEMHLLHYLITRTRPRVSLRDILQRSAQSIQALKPCFMMSPHAVAQFLAPGSMEFDIVVMDEASQLRPEQAIGAVARGRQLIVVGDPKQLPPTSFWSTQSHDGGDDDESGLSQIATSDAESILDVCLSHFQPPRTLSWHYRSRHESLIAFSNQSFYDNKLVVFPSPYPKGRALGLSSHYVEGAVYDSQMNEREARQLVDAVTRHVLEHPEDSIGIVTLNVKQRDVVQDLLQTKLKLHVQAEEYQVQWAARGQDLFVKSLENVQGDERDVIFISTTFGRLKGTGVVRQNFGPISRAGGWRRLNVLFTRARKAVKLFTSMRPEEIVSDTNTPAGTRFLRKYLEYAQTGILRQDAETDLPPDSDFEIAVMDVLKERGYEVVPQLGVAKFRIDLAVKHPKCPSGFLAAIECDGATYHSGASVRDRDRIRQEILESLGWKGRIWRIWSTDWFRNPLAESRRLFEFLKQLEAEALPAEYRLALTQQEPAASPRTLAPDPVSLEVFAQEAAPSELEIQSGDVVTYHPVGDPKALVTMMLRDGVSIPTQGVVSLATPLAQVFIGAAVGDEVVLRVPGQAARTFVVHQIRRDRTVDTVERAQ